MKTNWCNHHSEARWSPMLEAILSLWNWGAVATKWLQCLREQSSDSFPTQQGFPSLLQQVACQQRKLTGQEEHLTLWKELQWPFARMPLCHPQLHFPEGPSEKPQDSRNSEPPKNWTPGLGPHRPGHSPPKFFPRRGVERAAARSCPDPFNLSTLFLPTPQLRLLSMRTQTAP